MPCWAFTSNNFFSIMLKKGPSFPGPFRCFRLRSDQVSGQAVGIFSQHFVTPLNDQHTLFSVTSLGQFDLLVRTQHSHLGVVRINHPCIALTLEAVGDNLDIAEVTAYMLNEIRYLLIPLSRLPVTW